MRGVDRRSLGMGIVIGLGAGAVCFGLGLSVARLGAPPLQPRPLEPRILIPEGTLQLLPDASLRLELPPPPDAGSALTP
jgi:hypothetical protein